jgi:mycothiol system anti-sigma-R factor
MRAGDPVADHRGCADAVHRMYEYLDGELTPEVLTEMKAHLEACLNCFEAFDFEAELRQVIATRCRESVPESLVIRIQESIRIEVEGGGIGPIR